jgi:outer membrane autotransporter protein
MQIGAYVSRSFGPAYLSGAVSYAWHDMTTDRTVTAVGIEREHATFNATGFGGRLEGGYRFNLPAFNMTPYSALQVQQFHTPAYSERDLSGVGAFALSYDSRTVTATRFELGSWFEKLVTLDNRDVLALRTRFAWAHDHASGGSLGAAFQGLPGSNFVVNGAAAPSDSLLLTAGAEYRFTNHVTLGAKFDSELASRSQTYTGLGTVKFDW